MSEINPDTQFGIATDLNPQFIFAAYAKYAVQCGDENVLQIAMFPGMNRANLMVLSEAILNHIPYTPDQTWSITSAIDAFQCRQGVCQDHSHVFIAMCKYLGLPARYVSGYFFVTYTSHLASHASGRGFFLKIRGIVLIPATSYLRLMHIFMWLWAGITGMLHQCEAYMRARWC